jgi:hypothetical protein
MATAGDYRTTTIKITEDLSAAACQFHAIAFNDSKLANNPSEASGILLNKPNTNEFATICIDGEQRFAAGAAITAGDKITVTTSGWFVSASSSYGVIGEAKYSATSGSIGTGIFYFGNSYKSNNFTADVTATDPIGVGFAYALNDNKLANDGNEFTGVAVAAIASGSTGKIVVCGLTTVHADPATAITAGAKIRATTSGYFTPADSGYWICGHALAAIGSNSTGLAFVIGATATENL